MTLEGIVRKEEKKISRLDRLLRALDNRLARFMGYIPSCYIAEILNLEDEEDRIIRLRIKSIENRILDEIVGALSTYGSFSLFENLLPMIISTGANNWLKKRKYDTEMEFERTIIAPLEERAYELMPYYEYLESQIQAKGIKNPDPFSIFRDLYSTENYKVGLERISILSRPLIQASTALSKIPWYFLVPVVLISYGLIPVFAFLGRRDKKLRDEERIVDDMVNRSMAFGNLKLKDHILNLRLDAWKKADQNQYLRYLIDDLPPAGLIALSRVIPPEYALGASRLINQLFDTPLGYRRLVEKEMSHLESLASAKAFYETVSHDLLLTAKARDDYRFDKIQKGIEHRCFQEKGVFIDIMAQIPDQNAERWTKRLTVYARAGSGVLLEDASGAGKSVLTALGLSGIRPTRGTVYFTDEPGNSVPMEYFDLDEMQRRVFYISSFFGLRRLRVADVYQNRILTAYLDKYEKKQNDLSALEAKMLAMRDSDLEQQLWSLARDIKKKGSDKELYEYSGKCTMALDHVIPLFDSEDFERLREFRKYKLEFVNSYVKGKGGNFTELNAYQEFISLSDGMKVRFAMEFYYERLQGEDKDKTRIIIFDEPLRGLDTENAQYVLNTLKEELGRNKNMVYIIISHDKKDQIVGTFDNMQTRTLADA